LFIDVLADCYSFYLLLLLLILLLFGSGFAREARKDLLMGGTLSLFGIAEYRLFTYFNLYLFYYILFDGLRLFVVWLLSLCSFMLSLLI